MELENNIFLTEMQEAAVATLIFTGPLLIVATLLGIFIGFLQAVTQIQDQTLPQAVKIIVVTLVLALFSSAFVSPIYLQSDRLFSDFVTMVD